MIPPNSTIGILGGGQLGRMLALAAARLGFKTHVFAPEPTNPAYDVAAATTMAPYTDETALAAFAKSVAVITYEFENVPAETVEVLARLGADIAPGPRALAVAQDRLIEKQFARSIGAATAPFHAVDGFDDLVAGLEAIGRPAILKTRRLGYDGKGQTRIGRETADLDLAWHEASRKAWEEIGAQPSILEGFVDFVAEISIIGARGRDGRIALYDPPENVHRDGILRSSAVPARVSPQTAAEARRIAARMLEELDYIGVIGVEFFVLRDGLLMVNEFAPRVHNSGHWTLDACAVSQFEQHVRAICGWPFGSTERIADATMHNLIGEDVNAWAALAGDPDLCVHIYGKGEARPGRKMGHVTRLSPRAAHA